MPRKEDNNHYKKNWDKFLDGDNKALELIYFDFFDLLFNFGIKYSRDHSIIEDCIQNIFVDLLNNRHKLKHVNSVKYYLLKAMKNQIAYERRKTKNLFHMEKPEEQDFRINYSVEQALIANEKDEMQTKFLKLVKENLTDRQKEALYLKFTCGFDYPEISKMMDISVESARTMIYRTIKSIKKTFGNSENSNLLMWFLFQALKISPVIPQK